MRGSNILGSYAANCLECINYIFARRSLGEKTLQKGQRFGWRNKLQEFRHKVI
jgi:hypothetical protein